MHALRTPDDRFAVLPGFDRPPSYAEVPDGEGGVLRMAYVDAGPADGPVALLLHGEPSWSFLYRHVIDELVGAGLALGAGASRALAWSPTSTTDRRVPEASMATSAKNPESAAAIS